MVSGEPAAPEDADHSLYWRADALAEAGDHAGAVVLFELAAQRGDVDAWFALGNSLKALGRPSDAVVAYRRAIAGGNTGAPLNLGSLLAEVEDWAGAGEAYRLAQQVGDPRAVMAQGRLMRWHGDPDAAQALLQQAAAGGDSYAAGELGVWLLEQDPDAQVEDLLRQAVHVDDDARSSLAWVVRRRGELDEAEALLRQGGAAGHDDSRLKLAILLEEDRGDVVSAEALLRAAAEAGELFAWNNLGVLLRDQGRLLEAQECLSRGARGGDALARRNQHDLRVRYRRQLNRAHRRLRRPALPTCDVEGSTGGVLPPLRDPLWHECTRTGLHSAATAPFRAHSLCSRRGST